MLNRLDCIIIGYNETPFAEYEQLLHRYGEGSAAYQDLKYSFVNVAQNKLNYVGLMNLAYHLAQRDPTASVPEVFKSGDIPNLAAVYLANFLKKRDLRAEYINLFQYEKDKLIKLLAEEPLCVAITTTFYVLNLPVVEMVKFIRRYNSQVKIVVGGPLVANHFRAYQGKELTYALNSLGADIYVHESQGEQTLAQIIDCLKADADLARVPNIAYYEQGQLQITETARENNDMDANAIDWLDFSSAALGPTIQTRTARSCAFSCSFCGYPLRAGKLTLASLDTINREFSALQTLGAKNVVFIDDTFNVPLDRFKEICQLIIEKGYQFNWFSYFRCSNSDEEAIDLMAKSGCTGVFLGIESGSPSVLKNMHKAAKVEQYQKGIELLRQHHILTFGSFITGFPGETEQTVQETIDFIQATAPDYYRTQLWYCEPGTPIYNQRADYGIVGEGFRWEHKTMNSAAAMNHIKNIFLSVDQSVWMPQWSFDFWFIPYVLGKGLSLAQFKDFMRAAQGLLQLEFMPMNKQEKTRRQQSGLEEITRLANDWVLV